MNSVIRIQQSSEDLLKNNRAFAIGEGHLLRRIIHICMLFLPFIYYFYGLTIAKWLSIPLDLLIIIPVSIILLLELLRLSLGWVVVGQRSYERKQLSAFTWGAISIAPILLFLPKEYGIPIVAAWALGDPLLGELRRLNFSTLFIVVVGIFFVEIIWLLAALLLGASPWIALLMGPVTVAAEWPNLKWLDDNAMMLLIPFFVVWVLG